MTRAALVLALLLFLLLPVFAIAQFQPICDVSCAPDPGSGTYSSTVTARPKLPNARGSSSSIVPQALRTVGAGGTSSVVAPRVLVGSESYNYVIPILSLPGRNGLDLNLALYYNSRIWTVDSVNSTVTFNADRDFPSYGFRLGFGYIELDSAGNGYILTEADGSKRLLTFTATNSYDSTDNSFINYNPSTKVLMYKNGTRVTYESFPDSAFSAKLSRPKQVKDTNGNYITITYITGTGRNQHINTITDTLGRVINFNYDANGMLTSITQALIAGGTRTYATFTWNTAYTLKYEFAPSLTVTDSPANNSAQKVLASCTYGGNGVKYNFTYGDWGIVRLIEQRGATGALRSSVSYNYPAASPGAPLSDAPTWTTETTFDGVSTLSSTFSAIKTGGLMQQMTVTGPGGTKTQTNLYITSDWKQGLVFYTEVRSASNITLRRMDNAWISDTGGKNPRLSSVITSLSDGGQQSKVEFTYTTYGNVSLVKEYDYGLVLKRQTATTYLATSTYTTNTRHILDRPTQVVVKDAAGAIKSRTDFAYDLTAPAGLTPAPFSHDSAAYGTAFLTRANVTRITRYSNAAAGSGPFPRNFTYDIAGNLRTADLDCCTTKTWTYSSTTQYAYPDSVTSGPTGSQLTTSATYNFDSGTAATSTDENGKLTSYVYDGMDRVIRTTLPNSVQMIAAFNDVAATSFVTRTNTANSSTEITTVDGRGRVIQQQLKNGATVISTQTTAYSDTLRQVITGNPKAPTDPDQLTLTQLDYLGRTVSVTPPGNGGSYQYAYSGNVVTITDPAGKQRRNTSDALGRLVVVEEPGWGDATPGRGSVNIVGSPQSYTDPETCRIGGGGQLICDTIWDSGSISITVNGASKTVSYGQFSTATSVAGALANAINGDANYPANASTTGSTVNLTAKTTGAITNYTLSSSSVTNFPEIFGGPSFVGTPSGPTLTGGRNASGPDTATLASPMTTS